ncbi:MAG TPA: neutral/alkaline non-lysosomal ceramidase N-terminal domain-containing protein [Tepidisphaeraceae bacterium]|jgi:hypothetical protein
MLAGIAGADITPPVGTPLQGHFSVHPESRGVLAPLEIRTIVFAPSPGTPGEGGGEGVRAINTDIEAGSDKQECPHPNPLPEYRARGQENAVVIITADLIGVPLEFTRRVREAIKKRFGIAGKNVLIAASHTHCGPAMLNCIGLMPDARILEGIEAAMVRSVGDALKDLQQVTLGIGASAAHFNINRRPLPGTTEMFPNAAGVVDKRVRILRIDRMDGSPLGVLFHYSCHPTVKNGSEGLISPDYPGFARAEIEKQLQCRAAFLPGCFGDIRPNLVNEKGAFISASAEQLKTLGEQLAWGVINAAKFARTFDDDSLLCTETQVFFPFGKMLATADVEQISQRTEQPLRADWARRHLQVAQQGDPPVKGETSLMQAMQIGPLTLLPIPGEPAQEIGYEIEARHAGLFHDLWPVGYANDQIGYFCTPRMYEEGGYEPTAYMVYDRPAAFSGEQKIICDQAAELLERLRK